MTTQEPEPIEETWLFTGSRQGRGGKRVHAWLPLPDDDLDHELFYEPRGHPTVGSEYTAKVVRHPAGRVALYGKPVHRGRHDNEEVR